VGYLDALSDRPAAPPPVPRAPIPAAPTEPAAAWGTEPQSDTQVGSDDYARVVSGRPQRPIGAPAAEPEEAPAEGEPQKQGAPKPVLIALGADVLLMVLLVVLVLVL
jgi:hypothetical protein